ncbi:MAG: hypothetical protein ACKVOL_11000 [Novosphingobium sp.]
MKRSAHTAGLLILWLLTSQPAIAAAAADTGTSCGLGGITYLGQLQSELSRRAVEAVKLAAKSNGITNPRLKSLVAADAEVDLGAGDVGRPLGTGPVGLRALAALMKAEAYRFQLWTYIPTPVSDPCGQQEVTVEFSAKQGSDFYPIKFKFAGGVIVSAKGWTEAFQSGPMDHTP